jgi:hypothetical protein
VESVAVTPVFASETRVDAGLAPSSTSSTEDALAVAPDPDDALPAVGKVFDGPTRSLGAIFAANRATPRGPVRPVTDANVEPVSSGEFSEVMSRLRAALSQHGPGLDGILVYGQITSLADGKAVLRYRHEHEAMALMLERNGKREAIQQALSDLLESPTGLTIEVDHVSTNVSPSVEPSVSPRPPVRSSRFSESPAPVPAPPPVAVTSEQKQQILTTDPLVRLTAELFDADIVRVE